MYKLDFINPTEIRMGSPFNLAEVQLNGDFLPDMSGANFQDKGIVSADGKECYLVEWKIDSRNKPFFCVWRLSEVEKTLKKSELVEGCCDSIVINGKMVSVGVMRNMTLEYIVIDNFL